MKLRSFAVVLPALGLAVAVASMTGCSRDRDVREPTEPSTRLAAAHRVVAIGDLHGDLQATRRALLLAGAIDTTDRWVGDDLIVVQTGDILDRGDEERAIIKLFEDLGDEAARAGGAVYVLNGNHELMNAEMDFRYVTEGGFADFSDVPVGEEPDSLLAALEEPRRPRAAAFRPGGAWARILAERNTILVIGKTLFVHGGVLPEHVDMGIDTMNRQIRAWLRSQSPEPDWIDGGRSPVWTRLYSDEPNEAACDTLSSVLEDLGVDRMVVGHTVQRTGITSYCGARVWCIDVGMAAHYGGRPQVLEIRGEAVRGLR